MISIEQARNILNKIREEARALPDDEVPADSLALIAIGYAIIGVAEAIKEAA